MRHHLYTFRFKLTSLFVMTIVIPVLLIGFVIPYYYQTMITKEKQVLTEGTLKAMARNIETYLDDLERITMMPFWNENIMYALKLKANKQYENSDDYTKLIADRALNETLPIMLQNTRKDILGTLLISNDGTVYVTDSKEEMTGPIPGFPYQNQFWYKQAVEADGNVAFISAHKRDYLMFSEQQQVFSVARLIKDPDSRQPLAVIMAEADNNILNKMVRDISFDVSSIVVIQDDNNQLLYSSKPIPTEALSDIGGSSGVTNVSGKDYAKVTESIPQAEWKITVLLSAEESASKVRWLYTVAFLFLSIGLIVTFVLFLYLSRNIINPFKQMIQVMRKVQRGNLDARFNAKGRDEIAQLGVALNQMISQLNEIIIREYRTDLAKRDAEYRALQSQIHPHFLYNILNGWIGLNRAGEKATLEKAILALSGMLRYSLEYNDWSSIEEEFLFMQRYGELQQLRFDDRLTITQSYQSELKSFRIPKLLLQPLLENAIIHGCEPANHPCKVNILTEMIDDNGTPAVQIKITDNGVGFIPDRKLPHSSNSVGLQNVRERLIIAYGKDNARLEIQSIVNVGTESRITIVWDSSFDEVQKDNNQIAPEITS
ncbi:two-component system sensor histidine kinase YesM [Paenibacillus anaericanus]|uniref:cache domain-containing sensor histidine kinase n=1 Tax=Paenibacillus anaericanus TaxID=170367 RepID=UPI002782D89A|nr:sensor histidine kinase [Paenibacillus anaericanus]MDQ0089232.1 two-component system sensor histidine kinase YesM [Paenibacillus anaericanus]